MSITFRSVIVAAVLAWSSQAPAADMDKAPAHEPREFRSTGEVNAGGKAIRYRAIAGEIFLKNAKGEPIASVFSTTYLAEGQGDKAARPVAFIYNGGPGSASQWLHMGALGPRLVEVPAPRDDGAPPYKVGPNPNTILDVADLVFIDPVSTGWSRPLEASNPEKDFWGRNEDAASVAEFIRLWVAKYKRWNSPKYLMGESYGTTRTAALLNELELSMNDIPINGIVLMSTTINGELQAGDMRLVALMPSFAATAWYHDKIDKAKWNNDRDAFLADARAFALKEYAPALLQGQLLGKADRQRIVTRLSELTGLSTEFLERKDYRVEGDDFRKELLREEGFVIGHFDTRYKVSPKAVVAMPGQPGADPAGFGVEGAYTTSMLDYYYNVLGVDMDDKYIALNIGLPWRNEKGSDTDNESQYIARAMRENASLRVLQAGGLFDLATPFFATDMAFAQMGFDRDRIKITYYDGGHMMYTHRPSLEQLSRNIRAFVRGQ